MTPAEFAERCYEYCRTMGASETSGHRSHAHNVLVRGTPGSPHRFGLGRDVVYDHVPALGDAIARAHNLGLQLIREENHDHLQPLGWTNRPDLDVA